MQLKYNRIVLALLMVSAASFGVAAQSLPLDPAIRTGELANGFTYYIRKNTTEKGHAVLYLVNKVGSILETDEQQGLAHFMEHMNFNGTTHFPGNKLVDYLEKAGVRFGADLNAYTSYDETVYQLPIMFDQPELIQNGLQVMRDWAQEALLETKEIDQERGVILEEKRLHEGAQKRMQNQYFPQLVNHSRYADRTPIGTTEVLVNFKPETLRSFYKDWYRPDLQSLIIVGDIDVNAIEALVKSKFSDLKNPVNEKVRTPYTIALEGKNHFTIATDKENPSTSIQVIIKRPALKNRTAGEYRANMVQNIFNQLVAERFGAISRDSNPGYLRASASEGRFIANLDAFSATVSVKPVELEKGFKALWATLNNIKQNGFTASELDRVKLSLSSGIDLSVSEKDKVPSAQLVKEYTRYVLDGESAPGIQREAELTHEFLPGITLAEIGQLAQQYMQRTNRDIIVSGTAADRASLPDEKTVLSWMAAAEQAATPLYKDNVSTAPLLSVLPVPGKIVSEKKTAGLDITTLKLSNGLTVVLKPTAFKNDEINFMAFSPGGTSLYSDADYQSAANAAGVVAAGGLGSLNPIQLRNTLNGKSVLVQPYIGERAEGVSGSANRKNLETAFQMTYLYFTQPRKDTTVFNKMITRSKAALANPVRTPEKMFGDTINAVLTQNNLRRGGPSLAKLDQIHLDRAFEIYKERFADASDFTFVITGSFDAATIKPLLEQYLGSLPSLSKAEKAKDVHIEIPAGVIRKTVYSGSENKATVQLILSGDYKYSAEHNLELKALKEVIEFRLLDRLRETEGGVYSPGVQLSTVKQPKSRYAMIIKFGCSPANVEKLIAATLEEIDLVKKNGAPKTDLDKFKAEEAVGLKGSLESNNFWLSYLSGSYQNGEDPAEILSYKQRLDGLTDDTVKKAANTYLDEKNYIRFVLMPETGNSK